MTLWSTAEDPSVPKLAAAMRYLKEQLSASGGETLPSEDCLKDFALEAIAAAGRTQGPGESYIACICRHLDERALFIVLWMSSDQACDRAVWSDFVKIARKHAVPRPRNVSSHSPSGTMSSFPLRLK